ncbi:MAG: hypothetical protein KAR30_05775, partial [Gammaproteobacteria bacterium]|nr:hypothetical protein [Gammaproteobacteria bacterium]
NTFAPAQAAHDLILAFDEGNELCSNFDIVYASAGGCETVYGTQPTGASVSYYNLQGFGSKAIMVGSDGGIWVGDEQPAPGNNTSAPFIHYAATGYYYTDASTGVGGIAARGVPVSFITNPSSGSATLDFTSWRATWNGAYFDLGGDPGQGDTGEATITCTPAPCAAGSSFNLIYFAHVPLTDPGIPGASWSFYLQGTIVTAGDTVAPTQTNNAGSIVTGGGSTDTITSAELTFTDDLQPAASVAYTIISGSTNGRVEFTSSPGVAITSFTQDDINNNLVIYDHDAFTGTDTDSFTFNVDDGQGNSITSQNFAIDIDTDSDGLLSAEDADDDGDGMPDSFETLYGLDQLDAADATLDADSDTYDNLSEFRAGT